MAVRDLVDEPLALWSPAAQAGHVGLGPGLVDEDETSRVDEALIGAPARAMAADVAAVLFARDEGLLWNGPPLLPAM